MAKVFAFPGVLRGTDFATTIRAATPVQGQGQWHDMADAQVWLAGRGAQLASFGPQYTLGSEGLCTFPLYAYPHKQCTNWLWTLSLIPTSTTSSAHGVFTGVQGDDLGSWQLATSSMLTPQVFRFVESFDSMTYPYDGIAICDLDGDSDTNVEVASLSCVELPMYDATTFGSGGTALVDPMTCGNGKPIYEPSSGYKGPHGLMTVVSGLGGSTGLAREARRCNMFSWANGVGVVLTDSSYPGTSQFFESSPSVVLRHLFSGTNSGTVKVAAYAKCTGAPNTGNIRITAATGGTCTLSFSSASYAWQVGNLTVETEDLSRNATDGGLRGGSRETLLVEGRVTGGTTSMTVAALHVMEAE